MNMKLNIEHVNNGYIVDIEQGTNILFKSKAIHMDGTEEVDEIRSEVQEAVPMNMHDIRIKQLVYGYIVNVGCHEFAIETKEKLIEKLSQYITDPAETEKKWRESKTL